jgi:hypothetical protein
MGEMPRWLDRLLARPKPTPPLRGRPATRRVKHYAALSGYAYEYFHEGFRDAGPAREYHFAVSSDRRQWSTLRVTLREEALAAWQARNERPLAEAERYALAKLALFAAFDEADNPRQLATEVDPGVETVEELLARLDL